MDSQPISHSWVPHMRGKLLLWAGIAGSVCLAMAAIFVVHQFIALPAAETLRRNQIDALLSERTTELNGLAQERVRLGYDLAALGESFYALRHGAMANIDATSWERVFEGALQRGFRRFSDVVGGGVWYEPFVFDQKFEFRGYYIQWVPPVGAERKLQFTMEWSAPAATYHSQDWYRALIPASRKPGEPLQQDLAWTAPYLDPVTGVVMITIDAAMYDDAGKLIGMSTVDWNLDQISTIIQATRPTPNARAFLVDPTSKLFVAVTDAPELALKNVTESTWGRKINLTPPSESFWRVNTEIQGQNQVLYARALDSGLVLGFIIPETEIFTEVNAQNRMVLGALLGTVLFIMLILGLFARHITGERLKQLAVVRDEAVRTAQLKSEFLANMSHEIRTPMNGVLGMIDLALDGQIKPETREVLTLAHQSAHNLLRVINDILDFSKIEAGKFQFVVEKFSITELLNSTVQACQYSANSRQLTLVLHVSDQIPATSLGDAGRIRQILVNLIGNATKFNREQGGILVYAEKLESNATIDTIRISVCDSGVGIESVDLNKIFEAFTQGDGTSTRNHGGTGLGLTISQGLAREMGGRIEVRSKAGLGSVFSLIIPLPCCEAQEVNAEIQTSAVVTNTPAIPSGLGVFNILVAEDNVVNQQLVKRLLAKAGHSSIIVANGQEALVALERQPFDLILMDIQMPVMDGYQAVAEIRSGAHGQQQIPIVALTAHATTGDKEAVLKSGFNSYISKPIDRSELFSEISRLITEARNK